MQAVRFLGFAHCAHYSGSAPGAEAPWERLETREVPKDTAAYLVATFPLAFELVQGAGPVSSPSNRMASAPSTRGGPRREG